MIIICTNDILKSHIVFETKKGDHKSFKQTLNLACLTMKKQKEKSTIRFVECCVCTSW